MAIELNNEDRRKGFEEAAEPLMKWLCENSHPHTTVIVGPTSAELVEGTMSYQTLKFMKD